MPITQDRFLKVLDGAEALVNNHVQVRAILRDANTLISNGNAVLARTNDPIAYQTFSQLLAALNTIREVLYASDERHTELYAIILGEKKYFDRVGKQNARSAERQRAKRNGTTLAEPTYQRKGIKNPFTLNTGEVLDMDNPSDLEKIKKAMGQSLGVPEISIPSPISIPPASTLPTPNPADFRTLMERKGFNLGGLDPLPQDDVEIKPGEDIS